MSNPAPSRDELISAHFASMVMQNTQMAMMLLGQMPHPATGQTVVDLEGARMFIDQLEMLEVKTKGNLNKKQNGGKVSCISNKSGKDFSKKA